MKTTGKRLSGGFKTVEAHIDTGTAAVMEVNQKRAIITIEISTPDRGAMKLAYLVAAELAARMEASPKYPGRLTRMAAPTLHDWRRPTGSGSAWLVKVEGVSDFSPAELDSVREAIAFVTGIELEG